jgi:TetR/AcrR family transcriptional regulator
VNYISIAALGFFYLSNRWTLSAIFQRDVTKPARLSRHGKHIVDVIMAYLRPAECPELSRPSGSARSRSP